MNGSGTPWSPTVMDCTDGRTLFQVDAVSGAEPGWGYRGGDYRAEDTSRLDSAFDDALTDCYR